VIETRKPTNIIEPETGFLVGSEASLLKYRQACRRDDTHQKYG